MAAILKNSNSNEASSHWGLFLCKVSLRFLKRCSRNASDNEKAGRKIIIRNGVKTICPQDHFVVGDIIIYKKFKKKSEKNTKTYKSVRFSMDYDPEYHGGQFGDFEIFKMADISKMAAQICWKNRQKNSKKIWKIQKWKILSKNGVSLFKITFWRNLKKNLKKKLKWPTNFLTN